jgi:hypothetical protein
MPPISPTTATTVPATGEVISTVALSVITSAMGWSSATASPCLDAPGHDLGLAVPSPTSGSLNT